MVNTLEKSCVCPDFMDNQTCKHIDALLMNDEGYESDGSTNAFIDDGASDTSEGVCNYIVHTSPKDILTTALQELRTIGNADDNMGVIQLCCNTLQHLLQRSDYLKEKDREDAKKMRRLTLTNEFHALL